MVSYKSHAFNIRVKIVVRKKKILAQRGTESTCDLSIIR